MQRRVSITASLLVIVFLASGCTVPRRSAEGQNPCAPFGKTEEAVLEQRAAKLDHYSNTLEEKRTAYMMYRCLATRKTSHGINLARVAFLLASEEPDAAKRIQYASMGSAIAGDLFKSGNEPEAAYYYGVNQGLVLQRKGLKALQMLPDVLKHLEFSLQEPSIDQGGPFRALAMIYLKAPGKYHKVERALKLMKKCISLYPDHPLNNLIYAQVLAEDGYDEQSLKALGRAQKLLDIKTWGIFYHESWQKEINRLRAMLTSY